MPPSDLEAKLFDPDDLFSRARGGDDAAWEELFRACYPKVIRVVRRKLDRPMRSMFDSTDFASDVMKSLAANAGRLDFPSFQSLVAFLSQVAEQKVIDEYRKVHTKKRDIDRQVALIPVDDRDGENTTSLASGDPTASKYAQASEAEALLLIGRTEVERAMIDLKMQGYSAAEIADQLDLNLRKVQRFFKSLHEEYVGEEDEPI